MCSLKKFSCLEAPIGIERLPPSTSPQRDLMMPDGLFSRPVLVLKADHYGSLCSLRAKAVPPKVCCHQDEEGTLPTAHYSDPVPSRCLCSGRSDRSVLQNWTQGFRDLVNNGLQALTHKTTGVCWWKMGSILGLASVDSFGFFVSWSSNQDQ